MQTDTINENRLNWLFLLRARTIQRPLIWITIPGRQVIYFFKLYLEHNAILSAEVPEVLVVDSYFLGYWPKSQEMNIFSPAFETLLKIGKQSL